MRCWVKSRNERNPYSLLPRKGLSEETARDEREEGGDDVKSSWPLRPGLHTCYNGRHRGKQGRKAEPIPKSGLSWDRGLQLDPVNAESIVSADQPDRVEYVPWPGTNRPSHHESLLYPKPVRETQGGSRLR